MPFQELQGAIDDTVPAMEQLIDEAELDMEEMVDDVISAVQEQIDDEAGTRRHLDTLWFCLLFRLLVTRQHLLKYRGGRSESLTQFQVS